MERRAGLGILGRFRGARLGQKIEPLVAGTSGIAFPVHAERGQCGLVVFLGSEIALAPEGMFDIHARCFSLFDAVARMRPGESAKFPSISKRELECLKLTANGYTSEEIARLLKLSVHTANQYLTNTDAEAECGQPHACGRQGAAHGPDRVELSGSVAQRRTGSVLRMRAPSMRVDQERRVALRIGVRLVERHVVDLDRRDLVARG